MQDESESLGRGEGLQHDHERDAHRVRDRDLLLWTDAAALGHHGVRQPDRPVLFERWIADRSGKAVADEVWDEAADHFNEEQLSAIILMIGLTNFFNRINTTIEEPVDASW